MTRGVQEESDDSLTETSLLTEVTNEHNGSADQIIDTLRRIKYLMVYIKGMYHEDRQRRMAEAQIFRLRTDLDGLLQQYAGATDMLIDMHQPLLVRTQPR